MSVNYEEIKVVRNSKMLGQNPIKTLFLFSSRLEGLFRLGYPKHNVNTSNTLITQFQTAISKPNRELIKA